MSRVFVSGGGGFVGGQVVQALLRRGHSVTVMRRSCSSTESHGDVRTAASDLEWGFDARLVEGHDAVVHAAALMSTSAPWLRHHRVTVLGTRRLLSAAMRARVRRFVHVSSLAVLQESPDRIWRESTPRRTGRPGLPAYVRAKLEAEEEAEAAASRGLSVAIVRPGLVLGPGDRGTTPLVLRALRRGLPARVGAGRNRIPCVSVEELAETIAQAALAPGLEGLRVNLAAKRPPTQLELLETHANAAGLWVPRGFWPPWMARAAAVACEAMTSGGGTPWLSRLAVMIACADGTVEPGRSAEALGWRGEACCLDAIQRAVAARSDARAATLASAATGVG